MVLTAITKTPKLANCKPANCKPESFIGSMLTAAQLGLEPNTPLGQAYLIPYGSECQFQIGYKGLIDLAYRSGEFQCIMSEIVYENDKFEFEYGLNANLVHKPCMGERGDMKWVYAMYSWIEEKDVIIRRTVDAVMENLECLLDDCGQGECTAYPLSNRHNIYAEVTGDASEMWIDIKLEIYDNDGDCAGDLTVADTKDMSRESLKQAVTEIVKYYYGEV